MPRSLRHRLFIGTVALGVLPLAAALTAFALYVQSTGSPAGPRAALDEIATSGRAMIAAVDTTTLPDSARAAVRRHAETIGHRTTLARRAETLSRSAAALLGLAVLLGAGVVVGVALWLVRRWSAHLSRPIEELVEWTRRIERGASLPDAAGDAEVPPELSRLRTALREMAAALEQVRRTEIERERLAAFRETARRVAHEIRNPVNAIAIAVERLRRQGGTDRKLGDTVDVIAGETTRLEHLASEFGAFGRLPEGPVTEIDVQELIEGIADTVHCPVDRAIPAGLTVRARYEPLRRAVENVVRNAAAFTDTRGVAVTAARREAEITITVRDHGPGIADEDRNRIFAPYVTTRLGGTGLGLAIARQAVSADGGTLTAANAPDGGAVFTFTLPAV